MMPQKIVMRIFAKKKTVLVLLGQGKMLLGQGKMLDFFSYIFNTLKYVALCQPIGHGSYILHCIN